MWAHTPKNESVIMNVLAIAARETLRSLGFNIPTACLIVVSLGLVAGIVLKFYAPNDDPVSDLVPWLIEPIAWLIALAVVFLFLFVWNIFGVRRRERDVVARLNMDSQGNASRDDLIKSFLRNTLRDEWYGVSKCYVFGSVVRQDPTRDVDIVVQFDSSNERRVRVSRDRIRKVEREFPGISWAETSCADLFVRGRPSR